MLATQGKRRVHAVNLSSLLLTKTGSLMTNTPNIPQERQPDGRTVRDIVEHNPAVVNELWCRKILRQLLQSLDTQYANGAPHRLIMPDTIVVQANGDAVLLPDPDGNTDFQPEVAADLRALAAVIHFAITHEMPATGPLAGRGLAGYSDSLLGAVDRCMSPNKTQRPQTVAELRDLLGIVSVGLLKPSGAVPAVPSARAEPAPVPDPAPMVARPVDHGPPAPGKRWLWVGLAAVLLAAVLYVVYRHGAEELVGAPAQAPKAVAPAPAPAPAPAAAPVEPAAQPAAPAAPPASAPAATPDPAPARETQASAAGPAAQPVATYRLMVNPWGTVYVDGKRRGVSPPLKRLALPSGRHTIMLENPGVPDRIIQVNSVGGASGQIAHDFLAGSTPAQGNGG
jgi:hypothetical protein